MLGLSLVEVMVAMAIGLIVILGVVGIMGVGQQNLRISESLSESQENARMAFELIARDVRQSRDTSCGSVSTNSVIDLDASWWGNWAPVRGFSGATATTAVSIGSGSGQRVNGTEALQLQGTEDAFIINALTATTATLNGTHTLTAGAVVICDLEHASLHQVTASAGQVITLNPAVAISDPDNPQFQAARYAAVTWYIGNNTRAGEGGRSLYRIRYTPAAGPLTEEILPGVVDMTVRYHRSEQADFELASAITTDAAWETVNAIELTLVTESTQSGVATDVATANTALVGSDGRLRRTLTHVIAIRNISES